MRREFGVHNLAPDDESRAKRTIFCHHCTASLQGTTSEILCASWSPLRERAAVASAWICSTCKERRARTARLEKRLGRPSTHAL